MRSCCKRARECTWIGGRCGGRGVYPRREERHLLLELNLPVHHLGPEDAELRALGEAEEQGERQPLAGRIEDLAKLVVLRSLLHRRDVTSGRRDHLVGQNAIEGR
jgi:hypothetical protein